MKAIRMYEFGGPEVLRYEEVPEPRPGPGQLRVRVMAAGVNPVDWKMRQGSAGDVPLPLTPGLDVAGVVDLLGTEVTGFAHGDRVFAKADRGQGGYAEYTVLTAANVAHIPPHVSFVEAAAVPTAGLTAWQALFDAAHLQPEQTVLIHGAAGGVGSFAVQFAHWKGAYVFATASGDHLSFVRDLGANQVIDYTTQRFEEIAEHVDVVLVTVAGETLERSWQVLKPGGHLVAIVGSYPEDMPAQHHVHATRLMGRSDARELAQIGQLIEDGLVKPQVTTVLPLDAAVQAQEMSESHHAMGKIVLRVAEETRHMREEAA